MSRYVGSPAVERLRAILSGTSLRNQTAIAEDQSRILGETMLEAENLKIALERYDGHPIPALLLAHQLMAIKQCLQRGKKGIPDAINGLNLAIDSLFNYSDFYKVSQKLYMRRLDGTMKPNEEEKLRQLGIRI